MFPNRVPMESDTFPEPLVYLFFMSARIPQKGALLQNGEKRKVTVHGAPRKQKAYIQWGVAWFPIGMLPAVIHYLTAWKFTPAIW